MRVHNNSRVSDWKLKLEERFDILFGGHNNKMKAPRLSCGSVPCLKYHVKGYCWNDCRDKKSHRILEGNNKQKMDKFVKELRGK